jgi:hypothetical protein
LCSQYPRPSRGERPPWRPGRWPRRQWQALGRFRATCQLLSVRRPFFHLKAFPSRRKKPAVRKKKPPDT